MVWAGNSCPGSGELENKSRWEDSGNRMGSQVWRFWLTCGKRDDAYSGEKVGTGQEWEDEETG